MCAPAHDTALRRACEAALTAYGLPIMSIFAQAGVPPSQVKDLSLLPEELELFARIEGLVGQEAVLLAIPHEERDRDQHERLGAVSGELDRIWERLRERADRLGLARESHSASP